MLLRVMALAAVFLRGPRTRLKRDGARCARRERANECVLVSRPTPVVCLHGYVERVQTDDVWKTQRAGKGFWPLLRKP